MDKHDFEKLILAFDQNNSAEIQNILERSNEIMFTVVRRGPIQLLSLIQSFNLDINMRNKDKETLLMAAIQMGRLDFIELLLQMGADPNLGNKNDESALDIAWQSEEIATILAKYGAIKSKAIDPLSVFNLACEPRDLSVFDQIDIQTTDNNGWTLLMLAARRNWLNCVVKLIELGADVNQKGWRGQTPLIVAADYCNFRIVAELIQYHADLDIQDDDKMTALMYACKNQYSLKIIQQLFDYGANTSLKNKKRKTAKTIAEESGNTIFSKLFS